ncbi:hypothetical protein [Vitiosangium sp. GDMCC 1.1324]|nr:hypothetical protein [Vitiosangium sp. GDMCC 1.1324]
MTSPCRWTNPSHFSSLEHDTVQYTYSRMAPGHLPGTKGRLEELREGT